MIYFLNFFNSFPFLLPSLPPPPPFPPLPLRPLLLLSLLCHSPPVPNPHLLLPHALPQKKIASVVISDKIYVIDDASRHSPIVDKYDPDKNTWRFISHTPKLRYGCVGATLNDVFYIIGRIKIGSEEGSLMDLYDVEGGPWLRSRALPDGGCIVGACKTSGGAVVLEIRCDRDGRRKGKGGGTATTVSMATGPAVAGPTATDSGVCIKQIIIFFKKIICH